MSPEGLASVPAGLEELHRLPVHGGELEQLGRVHATAALLALLDRDGTMEVLYTETFKHAPDVQDVRRLSEEVGEGWEVDDWLA